MTIAKKGSRRIVVDGVEYRWTVRRRPTYNQANAWSFMNFAVVLAEDPGRTLVVSLPWAHPGNWMEAPSGAVRPALVARAIQDAVTRGWEPASPGPAFRLRLTEGDSLV